MSDRPGEVLLILDSNFGERLRSFAPGSPIWITMSATNAPIVRAWWADHPNISYEIGITSFAQAEGISEESCFLVQLENIESHHGRYSALAYTTLRVIGMELTEVARRALLDLGFLTSRRTSEGFIAIRSTEEANKLRV